MRVLRRLLPSILLVAVALGLGYVGWRAVQSEAAVAERAARRDLKARARMAASAIDSTVSASLSQTRDPDDGDMVDPQGRFMRPPAPEAMRELLVDRIADSEGAFYLDAAARSEHAGGTGPEARDLYESARGPEREPITRALASFRLGALMARDPASDPSERIRVIKQGLAHLSDEDRRTQEALVARAVTTSSEDVSLADDLLRYVGGPDDVIARGLLDEALSNAAALLATRESDLARMSWLSGLLPRTALTAAGALLDDQRIVAWRRGTDGSKTLVVARLPDLDAGLTLDTVHGEDTLFEDADVMSLPGLRVAATTSRSSVERETRRRGIWLGLALLLLVSGGVTALVMTLRAARRQADAARDQAAFLAQVGHDLRTPIANIRLYAETLASGRVDDPVESQEFAAVAAREAARVSSMVEKILELSRLDEGDPGKREVIDVSRLISEVVAAHRPLLEDASMSVAIDVPEEPGPRVVGQSDALKGALGNLVENALAHAHAGRSIEIGAHVESSDVRLRVADRGPGLPTELGSRVFERFVRGPQVTSRGCGLGLALVREVARAHGGEAVARDRDGGGAEFTLTLPEATT